MLPPRLWARILAGLEAAKEGVKPKERDGHGKARQGRRGAGSRAPSEPPSLPVGQPLLLARWSQDAGGGWGGGGGAWAAGSCCTARCVGCPPRARSFLLSLGSVLCILWMQISEHPAELNTRPRGGGTAPHARSPLGFCSSPCAAPRWQELLRASDSSALRGIHLPASLPASLPRSPTRSQ